VISERQFGTLLRAAVDARDALRRLPRTEWNSERALARRTAAREATKALAVAAGYTLADATHVVQHASERGYTLPWEVAARVDAIDQARIAAQNERADNPITLDELERFLGDFAAEVSMDLDKGLSGYGEGTVSIARKLATRLGLEWKA
jgi:hypothetical protein